MPDFFHTRDMEAAVRALADQYERVLVRNRHVLWNRIRLRKSALADLKPRLVGTPAVWDSELAAWNREGGLCIYNRKYNRAENVASHHAALVVEAPFSLRELDGMGQSARKAMVIFKPPNWSEHERAARELYPSAEIARRVWRAIRVGPRPSPELLAAIGRVEDGALVTDKGIAEQAGVRHWEVKRVRGRLRVRESVRVNTMALRCEPDDPVLARAYRFLEEECPRVGDVHVLVDLRLAKVARSVKPTLRDLNRCGAIALRDEAFFYPLDGADPDWDNMQRIHEGARERMQQVIAFVDSTPEFSLPAKPKSRSPARSAPSRRSSAASP